MDIKNMMKLKDGTRIEIEQGASIDRIIHVAESEQAALTVSEALTNQNLKHVEFSINDNIFGIYENLTAEAVPTRQTNENGTVRVTISLREKTRIELDIEALKESQEVQEGAIFEMAEEISNIAAKTEGGSK